MISRSIWFVLFRLSGGLFGWHVGFEWSRGCHVGKRFRSAAPSETVAEVIDRWRSFVVAFSIDQLMEMDGRSFAFGSVECWGLWVFVSTFFFRKVSMGYESGICLYRIVGGHTASSEEQLCFPEKSRFILARSS